MNSFQKLNLEHQIKLESQNRPVGAYPFAMRLAKEMGLSVKSLTRQKRKKELLITLISGPHVHKKSRDQYHIIGHAATLTISIQNTRQEAIFLEYKAQLRDSSISSSLRQNEGIRYTFFSQGKKE
jgi:ribosomal protein S10